MQIEDYEIIVEKVDDGDWSYYVGKTLKKQGLAFFGDTEEAAREGIKNLLDAELSPETISIGSGSGN